MPEQNEPLSERELEILRLVATGAANKEIARQLVISPNTVKVHLRNIFAKVGVSTRTEATLYAVQIGLVRPNAVQEAPEDSGAEDSGPEGRVTETAVQLSEQGLPGIVVEGELEGRAAAQANHSLQAFYPPEVLRRSPARPWKAWQFALVLLLALSLIGSGVVVGARFIATPTPFPTVVSTSATQTSTIRIVEAPRWFTKPVLPDGRKGMGIVEYEDAYYLVGGQTGSGVDGAVLRFDIVKGTWETMASKPVHVTDVQAVLLGEKIYVPGGRLQDGASSDVLEVYDPRANIWESKARLPVPVSAYALAAFEGQLYLFGGKSGDSYLNSVYVYSPQEDRWEKRTAMDHPRAFAGAALVGGKIHVIGGFDGQKALDQNQAYFPTRDGGSETPWENDASLPAGRYGMGVTSLASNVYLLGGLDETGKPAEPAGLQYSPQASQWNSFDTPPAQIGAQPALLASGNFLWSMGGETPEGLSAQNLSYQALYTITVPILRNDNGGE